MISSASPSERAGEWPAASGHCESGTRRPVLCLHCSTGSSRQWRPLAATIGESHRVVAPDLLGYGDNPPWAHTRRLRLEQEVRSLPREILAGSRPVDVVAHSFGAAVAVKLALRRPGTVRSLTLYEPVLFGLLREDARSTAALARVFSIRAGVGAALARGDGETAARGFIDFWSGAGSWERLPESRRLAIRSRMGKVAADFDALLRDDTALEDLARLDVPVLCLAGQYSPAATRRITDMLAEVLPRVTGRRIAGAGHMGPLTHADEVNACVRRFLGVPLRSPRERRLHTPFAARAA